MFVSKKSKWIKGAVLLVGLVFAAVGVGLLRAQHLRDAPNTQHFDYNPVEGKGGEEISGPYQVVVGWPQQITPGWTVGGVATYVESPDRIYAATRGEKKDSFNRNWGPHTVRDMGQSLDVSSVSGPSEVGTNPNRKKNYPVVVYDRNGKMIESLTEPWKQWASPTANPDDPGIPNVQRWFDYGVYS